MQEKSTQSLKIKQLLIDKYLRKNVPGIHYTNQLAQIKPIIQLYIHIIRRPTSKLITCYHLCYEIGRIYCETLNVYFIFKMAQVVPDVSSVMERRLVEHPRLLSTDTRTRSTLSVVASYEHVWRDS